MLFAFGTPRGSGTPGPDPERPDPELTRNTGNIRNIRSGTRNSQNTRNMRNAQNTRNRESGPEHPDHQEHPAWGLITLLEKQISVASAYNTVLARHTSIQIYRSKCVYVCICIVYPSIQNLACTYRKSPGFLILGDTVNSR